jgi:hypothetical protein
VATAELKSSLAQFIASGRGLKSDQKSEAQSWLDDFCRTSGAAPFARNYDF